MRLRAAAAAALLAVVVGGCGDGDPPNPDAVDVPGRGGKSAVFEVPLPKGAVKEDSPAGIELYRAREDDSMRGLQVFFGEQVGGRPLRGYSWCGATSNADNTKYALTWRKADTDDVLRVALDGTDPAGVRIIVAEEKGAPAPQCPPGPIDSIPGDPGDIPGV